MINYEKLENHVFVTKLAGFEHTKYIQNNQTKIKTNESDIPLVQGKNIRNGNFVKQYDWFISKSISDSLTRSKLTKPCILIPYVGSNLGEVGIFPHPYDCHLASNIAKIELTDDYFDLYYLKYYLQSDIGQSYLFQSKQGSAQPNITMDSIRKTLVINKNKKEQQKIANVFKKIENKIEVNNKINQELESLVKIIYDYWFLQFEFPKQNGKSYKTSKGNMEYNEVLKKEIPKNWTVGNLYNIAEFINGLACQKYRPTDEKKLPVIKIREMQNGLTNDTEFATSTIPKKYIINNNDILFSWSATLKVMLWYHGKGALNQHIFKVIPTNYGKYYTFLQLNDYVVNFIKIADARKTTMGHITSDHIKQSKIILPPKEIVKKFESTVEPIFRKILICNKENEELISLKKYLLPLLMNEQVGFKE